MKRLLTIISLTLVLVLCLFMFASCGVKSYAKRLEKAGYTVENATKNEINETNKAAGGEYKIKAALEATNGKDYVWIMKFATKKQAKDQAAVMEAYGGFVVEVKGKALIYGTSQGVKDALGK